MSENRKILKAGGLVGSITLLSRLTGLIRFQILGALMGTTLTSSVFYIAFELPNLFRRILGEGALSSIIVPIYKGRQKHGGDAEGWLFVNRVFNAIGLLTLVLTILGMIFSEEIFRLFTWGAMLRAHADPAHADRILAGLHQGAALTRTMFPYMIGLALASVMMGICHAIGRFAAPAFGSIVVNFAMIGAAGLALGLGIEMNRAATWVAWSVVIGAALRMGVMVAPLAKAGWRWRPAFSLVDPEVRQMFRLMTAGLLGLSISQINILVASLFAFYLGDAEKTYLTMANVLVQFPMALTATALATAMLPRLSHLILEGNREELIGVMGFTKRVELIFIIPAALGLMFFGAPIVELLFEHGRWDAQSSAGVYAALLFYAPGLLPLGWLRLLIPLSHARKDVITPVKAAGVSMIVNLGLAAGFTFRTDLGVRGLALASTLAAFANYGALTWMLKRQVGLPAVQSGVVETLTKCLAAGMVAIGAGWFIYGRLIHVFEPGDSTWRLAITLLPIIALSAAGYFALIHGLRVPDVDRAARMIWRRMNSRKEDAL